MLWGSACGYERTGDRPRCPAPACGYGRTAVRPYGGWRQGLRGAAPPLTPIRSATLRLTALLLWVSIDALKASVSAP